MDERLSRQLRFALELDKEKNVLRQTHLSNHGRRENDAEHAWHMAVTAYLLREYANEPVDIAKVLLLCLLHDVAEIGAGDAYAYDAAAQAAQKEKEENAAEALFSLLPADQQAEFAELFREFQEGKTPEARFARAMDNVQPLLLNHANGGSDWREHGVTDEQVYGRHIRTKRGSVKLYELTDEILRAHIERGDIRETDPTEELFPALERLAAAYGTGIRRTEDTIVLFGAGTGKQIEVFCEACRNPDTGKTEPAYIVCFATQHVHLEEPDDVADYTEAILRDEVLPLEFYLDGKNRFGGEIKKAERGDLTQASLSRRYGIPAEKLREYEYELTSWSGRYDTGKRPVAALPEGK